MILPDPSRTAPSSSSSWRAWLFAPLAVALVFLTPRAKACGVSASGVSSCSLAEHDEALRPRWALGVSGLYTVTRLRFTGALYADQVREAALGSVAYLPTSKWLLQAGLGVAVGGSLRLPDGKYTFSPGPIAVLGADYRAFDDDGYFLLLTSGLSFTAARTRLAGAPSVGYAAFDLRLGAELGVELGRLVRPYVLARAFGGPVFWRYHGAAVDGTDTHHYQFGVGSSVQLVRRLSVFVEGVPLGERAVSAGVALSL